jgi:hypothetical protein
MFRAIGTSLGHSVGALARVLAALRVARAQMVARVAPGTQGIAVFGAGCRYGRCALRARADVLAALKNPTFSIANQPLSTFGV